MSSVFGSEYRSEKLLNEERRIEDHNSRHQIAFFMVTAESYNTATRAVELRGVKTVRNSQYSKASSAVLFT